MARDPPLRRVDPRLLDELHRFHVCRTFTHQFSRIAIRPPPVVATPFPTLRPYIYRQRFGPPSLGLAAVKHAQAKDERRQAIETFRFNASVRRRHRHDDDRQRRYRVAENIRPRYLKNREEQRIDRSEAAKAAWKLMAPPRADYHELSFEEKVAMHYVRGTLQQFLETLRLAR